MEHGSSQPTPAPRRKKLTLEEIRAFNAKLMSDPKIQAMIEESNDPANAGDVVRWEDLKRKHAGR